MMNDKKAIDFSNVSRKELEKKYIELNDKYIEVETELNWLKEQIRLSNSNRYGSSADKGITGDQISIFDEAELWHDAEEPEPTSEEIIKEKVKRKKKKGQKKSKTNDLPVERVDYKLSEEEQFCPKCRSKLHVMKKIVHDEIEVIPAKYIVHRDVQYVYSCRNCERNDIKASIVKAPAPNHLFSNSLASPSFVADIINRKYVLALPLYRQERELSRRGININRQTLSNWILRASDLYLYRIYEGIKKELLSKDIIHADETEVQVLREPGREADTKSYMWVYTSNEGDIPCYIYEYQPGRKGEYPKKFLKSFSGYLQTDGYSGYNQVSDDTSRDDNHKVIHVGCAAHARRKFTDALKASSEKEPPNIVKGIAYWDKLFKIEKECKDLLPEERKRYRKSHAEKVLDDYFAWLESIKDNVLPKSKLGKAVTYSLNQKENLRRYLEDGRLEISNNRAERAVKPFVIGRKNWLFANTPDGAKASAMIYSIAETVKANHIKPFEYFTYVLSEMSQNPSTDINALMPWSKSLPKECVIPDAEESHEEDITAANLNK